MSNNIIYSSALSDALNDYVSKKIDNHLFLVCNYNPESLMVYSDDAKFIKGTMNMYKFLIDAGICNRLCSFEKKYNLSPEISKLKKTIDIINSIRTYIGHNEDHRNGFEESKHDVERWFSDLIGKQYPESPQEYEKALEEIIKYGDECVKILYSFIDEVAQHKRKQEIIENWEGLIFDFYKRPNSKKIFVGNIKIAYQSRVGIDRNIKDIDVAMWTKKMLFCKEQSQIDNLRELIKGRKLSNSVLMELDEKINENKQLINEKNEQIARFVNKSERDLRLFDYLDYYIASIPQRIVEESKKENLISLLPQDVVQKIIESDFSSVTI